MDRLSSDKLQVCGRYHRRPARLSTEYEREEQTLGTGMNGSVVAASNRRTGSKVALKPLRCASSSTLAMLQTEIEVFLTMDHPHVARLLDVYESSNGLELVMERLDGGELFDQVKSQKQMSEPCTSEVAWQMLLALSYLHDHQITHGDVKLENWMYTGDLSQLKLIDFGFSKVAGQGGSIGGTAAYMAPEVLDRDFKTHGDMWSLGVTVFVMLAGRYPFRGTESRRLASAKAGLYSFDERWASVSSTAKDFVAGLLQLDPKRRLSAQAALDHAFITRRMVAKSTAVPLMPALKSFSSEPIFRRCCHSMMAWSLSEHDRAELYSAFVHMDKGRRGRIGLAELQKAMPQEQSEDLRQLFQALAVHPDGQLHYSDFLAAQLSAKGTLQMSVLRACFEKFDLERTGFVTEGNVEEVLGMVHGLTATDMLADIPSEHKGQFSWREFVAYMTNQEVSRRTDEILADLPFSDR